MMVINLMIIFFKGGLKLLNIFQISLNGMMFSKYENHVEILSIYTTKYIHTIL